jgi:nitroimidazol reductase NimA-like FMN-containing flavoprotein (pyridoxamine 5'-phosphate oxidase superfamily)
MAFVPDDRIGSLGAADLARFLAEPWNARIATVDDEGWPYVTPVWYEFDAATRTFEIVGRESRCTSPTTATRSTRVSSCRAWRRRWKVRWRRPRARGSGR